MPDFTMCDHPYCPAKKDCLRHPDSGQEPNGMRQSWFLDPPGRYTVATVHSMGSDYKEKVWECKYYMEN